MVQRRERLKKQLLKTQLELLELRGEEILEAAASGSSGYDNHGVEAVDVTDGEKEGKELDSGEEEDICSPPSVRQTRYENKVLQGRVCH